MLLNKDNVERHAMSTIILFGTEQLEFPNFLVITRRIFFSKVRILFIIIDRLYDLSFVLS